MFILGMVRGDQDRRGVQHCAGRIGWFMGKREHDEHDIPLVVCTAYNTPVTPDLFGRLGAELTWNQRLSHRDKLGQRGLSTRRLFRHYRFFPFEDFFSIFFTCTGVCWGCVRARTGGALQRMRRLFRGGSAACASKKWNGSIHQLIG